MTTTSDASAADRQAQLEMKMIGSMLWDHPGNARIWEIITPEYFREPLLRSTWVAMAEWKRQTGTVNVNAVCAAVEEEWPGSSVLLHILKKRWAMPEPDRMPAMTKAEIDAAVRDARSWQPKSKNQPTATVHNMREKK